MSYHNSLSIPDPPPASQEACAAPTAVEFGCRLPLVVNQPAQAALVFWFKLERQAGPLTQGTVIRSVTLPASGSLQLQASDRHACFVLETDSVSVFRCETVTAEAQYWSSLLRLLGRLETPGAHTADLVQVQGESVSYPLLTTCCTV